MAYIETAADGRIEVDAGLIQRLDRSGPRYTSYPTADRFQDGFGYGDYLKAVAAIRVRNTRRPLSLYVHVPFCENICYYCGCNKIIGRDRRRATTYLDYLYQEIAMQGQQLSDISDVVQLHFGGGTPTFLSDEELAALVAHLHATFRFASDAIGEYSIEIDPRTVSRERIHRLRHIGFNRLSLGVQDFDADVQKAVNRLQPESLTLEAIAAAREAGFRSVGIDLIYGLPQQTIMTMQRTLAKVIEANPDRIALYSYAHLPHIFKAQRRIHADSLPSPSSKLDILMLCIQRLTAAGYVYIGMDHFAKPDDDLVIAQRQGRLHRNFQGYSTHADTDLVGCGVSAISAIGTTYSQNAKTLEAYYDAIDRGVLPVVRGVRLTLDDLVRRSVIHILMCHFELSVRAMETAYPITFSEYFADELQALVPLQQAGLVTVEPDWITVTPKGRLLVRNLCMVFDRYLSSASHLTEDRIQPMRYSRTV